MIISRTSKFLNSNILFFRITICNKSPNYNTVKVLQSTNFQIYNAVQTECLYQLPLKYSYHDFFNASQDKQNVNFMPYICTHWNLFQFIDGHPVSYSFVKKQLSSAVCFIGLDPKLYKGYSFCIGVATHAAKMGYSENYIQKMGDGIQRQIKSTLD